MTISTAECELTVTFTDEEHGEPCSLLPDLSCQSQALWRLLYARPCDHIPLGLAACQKCRDDFDRWLIDALLVHCVRCGAPAPVRGWEPIGRRP